jgi:hypothetical protein
MPLKIFIWNSKQGFYQEYASGLAVAIAETADQARSQVLEKIRQENSYLWDTVSTWEGIENEIGQIDQAVMSYLKLDTAPQEFPLAPNAFFLKGSS